jgi:hypothetical protein
MKKFRLHTRSPEEFDKILSELLAVGFCFSASRNRNTQLIKEVSDGTYLVFIFGYYECLMQFELCSPAYFNIEKYQKVNSVTELINLIG